MIIVQKKMDDTPSRGARTTHDPTTWMIIVQKKMDDTPSRGVRTTHDPTDRMIIVQKKMDDTPSQELKSLNTALGSDGQGPNGLLSFFWIFSILFDFV